MPHWLIGSGIGLEGGGQQRIGRVAGECEKQMPDVLRRDAVLEQRVVDGVGQGQVVEFKQRAPR